VLFVDPASFTTGARVVVGPGTVVVVVVVDVVVVVAELTMEIVFEIVAGSASRCPGASACTVQVPTDTAVMVPFEAMVQTDVVLLL
jgi:hypothetical protein